MAFYEIHLSLDDTFDDDLCDEENVGITFKRDEDDIFDVWVSRSDEDDEFEPSDAHSTAIVTDEKVLSDLAKSFVKAVKALKEAN